MWLTLTLVNVRKRWPLDLILVFLVWFDRGVAVSASPAMQSAWRGNEHPMPTQPSTPRSGTSPQSGLSAMRSWLPKRSAMTGLLAVLIGTAAPSALSWATPPRTPATPGPAASCSYRLDPPRRTTLASGVAAVTSSIVATSCSGDAQPVRVTACIRADGVGTQCHAEAGWTAAELNFRPWRAGLTYIATGNGCALVGNPPVQVCTQLGPISVGL